MGLISEAWRSLTLPVRTVEFNPMRPTENPWSQDDGVWALPLWRAVRPSNGL
jgi:hypothetical protein